MFTSIIALLGSGSFGGLLGGAFSLIKQWLDRGERAQQRADTLARDRLEYEEAERERAHSLLILSRTAEAGLRQAETESAAALAMTEAQTEAEIAVANQQALSAAQGVFAGLKTSSWMDNYRGGVRPTLALYFSALFSICLWWFFDTYADTITDEEGKTALLGLVATLNFTVTSIVTFYFVSRRNQAPCSRL